MLMSAAALPPPASLHSPVGAGRRGLIRGQAFAGMVVPSVVPAVHACSCKARTRAHHLTVLPLPRAPAAGLPLSL